jgi:hypothetical protein
MDKPIVQIWMAEDNEADIFLMRAALDEQALQYRLLVFRNGEEAVRLSIRRAVHLNPNVRTC